MARHNIEKYDFFYSLLKKYMMFGFRLFYKKIEITGYKENVPENVPLIFTANHQNALIDAFAVHYSTPGRVVFLARSDIFENPTTNKILTFFKILPIFRIRDGIKNLSRNQAIFEKTVDILHKNGKLGLLPEGNHAGFRKLRILKKGIARIVFQSAEKSNFDLSTKIIPVGVDYSHYVNFRSKLFVNYGEPVDVSKYYDDYKENPQRTMVKLLAELKEKLSEVMIDIRDDQNYQLYDNLRMIYRKNVKEKLKLKGNSQKNAFLADKNLISKLEKLVIPENADISDLKDKTKKYVRNLEKLNLRNWVIEANNHSFILVILQILVGVVLLPIHLYGVLSNYLQYKIPVWYTNKKVKDVQFLSSFRFALAVLLFPIFYIIYFLAFGWIYEFSYISLIFLISMPITGSITFWNYIFLKKRYAQLRFIFGKWKKNPMLIETINLQKEIISYMDDNIDFND